MFLTEPLHEPLPHKCNLEVVARADGIGIYSLYGVKTHVSHNKRKYGTKNKQTNKTFSSHTLKSHEMYRGVKDSFGVQMNNLKQIRFLERQQMACKL